MQTHIINALLADVLRERGRPLPTALRRFAERRLGVDLGRVCLHDDPAALEVSALLRAEAFTFGRHIVLGERMRVAPDEHILLHEIAHAVQQGFADPTTAAFTIDPDAALEVEAEAFAMGTAGPIRGRLRQAVVQRHPGPICPRPPRWIEITNLRSRELWLPANQAIEAAYLAEHVGNTILLGSQFEGWRDIRLPRGVANRGELNTLLGELRGLSQQRAPDIVDLTENSFYEIKTAGYAEEGIRQLQSLYRLVDAIVRQHGGSNWNSALATWYPPHLLPFPGDPNKVVCTADTNHMGSQTGLLIYRVFRKTTQEEERELRQRMVVIQDLSGELETMRDRIHSELGRVTSMVPSGTPLWIIASPDFFREFIFRPQQERMERTLDLMRVHGLDARRNPVIGFRNVGWTIIGISVAAHALTCAVVMTGSLVLEAAAPLALGATTTEAAGSVAATAGLAVTAEEATVVSLTAYRAARAAEASIQIARAAGVLFVISTVSVGTARAQSPHANVLRTSTVRAVPAAEFTPRVQYEMYREVVYGGEPYRIVGRALVP